ncbi:MAG: lysophospholipid acyltransferase family protein [Planctomycetota bacterium]
MTSPHVAVEVPTNENDRERPSASPQPEKPVPGMVRLRIWIVRTFLVFWIRCFSLSGLYLFGRAFGTVEYALDARRRRRVRRELREMFKDEYPPAWHRKMAWRYFMRIRCDKMFYTIMDRIPRAKLLNRIKMKGRKHIEGALAGKKGAYVALCHFGSFHVAGLLGALLGYDIVGVRDPKESHVRRYIGRKYRETFPEVARMRLFYSGAFPREIYRQFQSGGIVASLLDVGRRRDERLKTCPVRIFGETQEFLTGPVQMAIRAGAPILQAFVVSRRNFYYQMVVTPVLYDPTGGENEDAIVPDVVQRYADGVEQFAREHPDHLMNI